MCVGGLQGTGGLWAAQGPSVMGSWGGAGCPVGREAEGALGTGLWGGGVVVSPLRIGVPGEPWAFGEPPRRTPSGGHGGDPGLGAARGGPRCSLRPPWDSADGPTAVWGQFWGAEAPGSPHAAHPTALCLLLGGVGVCPGSPPAVWVPGGVSGGAVRAGARLRAPPRPEPLGVPSASRSSGRDLTGWTWAPRCFLGSALPILPASPPRGSRARPGAAILGLFLPIWVLVA